MLGVSIVKAGLGQRCLDSLHFKGEILWTIQVMWQKPHAALFQLQEMVLRFNIEVFQKRIPKKQSSFDF